MDNQRDVGYKCTREDFRPAIMHPVRWLDWEQDLEMARELWGMEPEPFRGMWNEAREQGYQYCAVIEEGKIIARAAVWRYSDTAWELAAVFVREDHQRRGYGKSVCSCATATILDAGRIATCHTRTDNLAMRRTAESIGFQQAD